MKNEIGIAIIDVYGQDDLNLCYDSIPEGTENVIVVSDTNNKLPDCEIKRFGNGVPFATLRNWAIHNFRIKGLKHFFLINSNQIIKDPNIFEKTIKMAEVFGIWAFTGPEVSNLTIEDDENNLTLTLSDKLNSDFIYLFNGIISNVGFFDERFFNTKDLDVLDYILRMREKKVFPPTGYNAIISNGVDKTRSKITKPNYKEISSADQSVNLSYAYFLTKYQYIPSQNDPKPESKENLMGCLEDLQKNYAKK
jgi:hypothetical protein